MSSVISGTASGDDLPEDDEILALTGGENPVAFLTMNAKTIFALIGGMRDRDRIEGWRRAEQRHIDSDRTSVLEALDKQARALDRGEEPPIYHPPIHDGQANPADGSQDAAADADSREADVTIDPHPDADLDAGEVLEVDRGSKTEYIWPARAGADEPYVLREYAGSDDLRQELSIGQEQVVQRLDYGPERRDATALHLTPPEAAAVGGESRVE